MKKFSFTINGNQYDVEIKDVEDNIAEIEVNGTTYEVEVHREVKKSKTPTLVRSEVPTKRQDSKIKKNLSKSSNSITAPLPGNIIDIMVSEGDEVKKGQKLLIYEAMKMENEVRSDRDGVVKSIKVAKGDSVLEEQELMEIA